MLIHVNDRGPGGKFWDHYPGTPCGQVLQRKWRVGNRRWNLKKPISWLNGGISYCNDRGSSIHMCIYMYIYIHIYVFMSFVSSKVAKDINDRYIIYTMYIYIYAKCTYIWVFGRVLWRKRNTFLHWKENAVILMKFSSHAASKVVIWYLWMLLITKMSKMIFSFHFKRTSLIFGIGSSEKTKMWKPTRLRPRAPFTNMG